MKYFEIDLNVRFVETDEMGIVHHTNYLVWMENARFEILKTCGLDYRAIKSLNLGFLVTRIECNYILPAKFGDEIVVETRLAIEKKRLFNFYYLIRRKRDYELLARGETVHVIVKNGNIVLNIPDEIKAKILEIIRSYGWDRE